MSTGKQILMLGTSPEARGGIATVVQGYRDAGLLDKWRVRYIVTHVQTTTFAKLGTALSAFKTLLWLLVKGRVALLHVHMSSRASTWRKSVFLLAGMSFGVPCLIHMHGGNYVEFYQSECGAVRRWLIRWLLNHATKVIVLSPGWSSDIRTLVADASIVILYNSVALPPLANRLPERQAGDAPTILFLGRISAPKGSFDLIRAAALVESDFKLVLCGLGDIEGAGALAESLGLSAKIRFAGWVNGTEKEQLLTTAYMFVLPSYYEGVPMAILEAMSWGLPIVATLVGGIPEVVTNETEGILVTPGDIQGLALALITLLEDPKKSRKMGNAGRVKIEKEYSQAVLLPQLEHIWQSAGAQVP